jgi:hypothetical protein
MSVLISLNLKFVDDRLEVRGYFIYLSNNNEGVGDIKKSS